MPGDRIARRSVAFFLIKSSVNFVAVAVLGTAMAIGLVGPELSLLLTALPAVLAVAVIALVLAIPRLGPGREPGPGASRLRRAVVAVRRAVIGGTAEAVEILRSRDLTVLAGAIGYWAFDNAVLWATSRPSGRRPDLRRAPAAATVAAVLAYRIILFWLPLVGGAIAFAFLRRALDRAERPDLCVPIPAT